LEVGRLSGSPSCQLTVSIPVCRSMSSQARPANLAATHPGRHEEQPGGVQPVAADVGDEGAQLVR
jgi:hypothetical protein